MIKTEIIEVSPQFYRKVDTFYTEDIVGNKAIKSENIYTSTITVNDLAFDSDEDSMNRIARYVTIANYKYNKLCSQGTDNTTAYQTVYIDATVEWKLANNTVETVSLETLCEVLELSILNMKEKWI